MTLTLSTPLRIAGLCALAAALTIGGGLMLLGRAHHTAAPAPVIVHHPFGPGAKSAAKHKHAAPARATAKTLPKTVRPAPRPAAERAALAGGLPAPLAHALGQHAVVVAELYEPGSSVSGIALGEARAGAAVVGAGFVPLDVLSKANVRKLTLQLGEVLPVPGLLVYSRPATLVTRIDGFADKDTVAQAAQNAARGG